MRNRQRAKMCGRKRAYASRKAAKQATKRVPRHTRPNLHAYRCPYCGAWHVGHSQLRHVASEDD